MNLSEIKIAVLISKFQLPKRAGDIDISISEARHVSMAINCETINISRKDQSTFPVLLPYNQISWLKKNKKSQILTDGQIYTVDFVIYPKTTKLESEKTLP